VTAGSVARGSVLVYDVLMRGPTAGELLIGLFRMTVVFVIAFGLYRVPRHVPWPFRPFRLRYVLMHIGLWLVSAYAAFFMGSIMPEQLFNVQSDGDLSEFLFLGGYFYLLFMGMSYTIEGRARVAHAETAAAQMQLSALRAQIQPHFLFNALHAVVQLIPLDPPRAMDAAELVGGLLRTTMEEERDVVSLRDEWSFVSRYLDLERIRFGDRLRVQANLDDDLLDAQVPSFALQTLVENAVRHGAAPRIEPTDIAISATGTARELTLTVRNQGNGAPNGDVAARGTGLKRLRERLAALYGNTARLTYGQREDGAFQAIIVVPRKQLGD
jgi:two-component system LytT family sensor kinase